MKHRFIVVAAISALIAASLTAAADYVVKDGNGATLTIFSFVCFTTKVCATSVPIDSAGGDMTDTTNHQLKTIDQNSVALLSAVQGAIPSGTNVIGKVSIDQTTPGTTNVVQTIPGTTGGLTAYFVQPTASDNHANIKNGAGQVYGVQVTNNSATVNYLRLYNAATGFNGCNSATNLVGQWLIPGSTSGAGIVFNIPNGLVFSTGISVCVTSGYATTDTTNATASAMSVNVSYK